MNYKGKKNLPTKKEMLAMELTWTWYVVLSETSNAFLVMSKDEEDKWFQEFTDNTMRDYTAKQIQEEIVKARKYIKKI